MVPLDLTLSRQDEKASPPGMNRIGMALIYLISFTVALFVPLYSFLLLIAGIGDSATERYRWVSDFFMYGGHLLAMIAISVLHAWFVHRTGLETRKLRRKLAIRVSCVLLGSGLFYWLIAAAVSIDLGNHH